MRKGLLIIVAIIIILSICLLKFINVNDGSDNYIYTNGSQFEYNLKYISLAGVIDEYLLMLEVGKSGSSGITLGTGKAKSPATWKIVGENGKEITSGTKIYASKEKFELLPPDIEPLSFLKNAAVVKHTATPKKAGNKSSSKGLKYEGGESRSYINEYSYLGLDTILLPKYGKVQVHEYNVMAISSDRDTILQYYCFHEDKGFVVMQFEDKKGNKASLELIDIINSNNDFAKE